MVVHNFDMLLGEDGLLRLPSHILDNYVMDNARLEALKYAYRCIVRGENVLIIGSPGTGKTAFMAILLKRLVDSGFSIAYILEGVPSISRDHEKLGIIIFYDDLPRMNTSAMTSIFKNNVKGIVATARIEELQFITRTTSFNPYDYFRVIEIPPMAPEHLREILLRFADAEGIQIAEPKAIDIVVSKADGLPIYIWQVIRELRIKGEPLTADFAEIIPKGMYDYVDDILWRILGRAPERYEALLTLLIITDLVRYEIHQDLYNYVYLVAKELRLKRKLSIQDVMFDEILDNITRYLARDTTAFSFRLPHDSWADVLRGKSKGPMSPEIAKINALYNEEERKRILISAARRAWVRLKDVDDKLRKETFLRNLETTLGKETLEEILKYSVEEEVSKPPLEIVEIPNIEAYISVLEKKITKPLKDEDISIVEDILQKIGSFLWTPREKNIAGVAYMRLWEKTKKEEYFKHGEKLLMEAKNAKAYYNLGVALIRRGACKEAKKYLEKALELDPTNKRIRHNLALVELRLGNKKKAKLILEGKALKRGEAK